MSLTTDVLQAVTDHAAALGVFDRVGRHEPKSAPGNGLTAAVWVQRISPVPSSGLTSSTIRLVVQARIYTAMSREPQDDIDPVASDAALAWVSALTGDLKLAGPAGGAGVARSIDVRGIHGVPLEAQAGYVEQDSRLFRVYTLTIPVLINDVWEEA